MSGLRSSHARLQEAGLVAHTTAPWVTLRLGMNQPIDDYTWDLLLSIAGPGQITPLSKEGAGR